jgi:C_GCAxxG_C_C family probable redox protein
MDKKDLQRKITEIINKNEKAGYELREWLPKLSCGQKELLTAAENLERAVFKLKEAEELINRKSVFMTDEDIERIAARAEALMPEEPGSHYHCAEAFTIAVGEHFFGDVENRIRRMTTGFSGGVGGTHAEMCGALFGGVLIIGALYGRARPYEPDEFSYKKSVRFREEFIKAFGGSSCQAIKDTGYGSQGIYPCGVFVRKAVKLFFKILMED